MKTKFKKLLILLCVLTCAVSLCGCGNDSEAITCDETALTQMSEYLITQLIVPMDADSVAKVHEAFEASEVESQLYDSGLKISGEGLFAAFDSWLKCQAEIGELDTIDSIAVTAIDEDEITVSAEITGTTGKTAQVEMLYTPRNKMTSCVFNVNRSFGELMTNAALNTLLGMGTVFVVLILISLIIACFKYISVIEEMMKKKKEAPSVAEAAVDNTVAQIVAREEQSDDTEIIAVISAAIAAYESATGGSSDGFVVRSIKRRY